MATIINSDIIPLKNRGMYQAAQNGLLGFGAICGASLGGVIADSVGWRWCFLCQVPVSMAGLMVGYFVIENPPQNGRLDETEESEQTSLWTRIDLAGATLLVLGLSAQLTALSLGGNQYPWSDFRVITSFVVSVVILVAFVWVELRTKALPVLPMSMLHGRAVISNMVSNVLVGMSAFAVSIHIECRTEAYKKQFLFTIPLFFQVVLSESASKAGMRLVIPSLGTPVGGLIAGFIMSRWGMLNHLIRLGCLLMAIGNGVMATLNYHDSSWKYIVYLFPANLGQGIVFPSILFTNIAAFQQSRTY